MLDCTIGDPATIVRGPNPIAPEVFETIIRSATPSGFRGVICVKLGPLGADSRIM